MAPPVISLYASSLGSAAVWTSWRPGAPPLAILAIVASRGADGRGAGGGGGELGGKSSGTCPHVAGVYGRQRGDAGGGAEP